MLNPLKRNPALRELLNVEPFRATLPAPLCGGLDPIGKSRLSTDKAGFAGTIDFLPTPYSLLNTVGIAVYRSEAKTDNLSIA
jgi:hypothetical protein